MQDKHSTIAYDDSLAGVQSVEACLSLSVKLCCVCTVSMADTVSVDDAASKMILLVEILLPKCRVYSGIQ